MDIHWIIHKEVIAYPLVKESKRKGKALIRKSPKTKKN